MANLPPLSLYIHIPWCVQKCPYCDFNSHALKGEVPHDDYVAHLLADLDADVPYAQGREVKTIFIGGGTPSLLSGPAMQTLLDGVRVEADWAARGIAVKDGTAASIVQLAHRDSRAQAIVDAPEAYPPEYLDLLARNSETLEFVLGYPAHHGDAPVQSLTEPLDTVPLLLQWDMRWGYQPYGESTVAVSGCAPACLSMAASYLTGDPTLTPYRVAQFAAEQGYYVPGQGTSWSLLSEGAPSLGVQCRQLALDQAQIDAALDAGHPVICSMLPGDFTTEGHFIVLYGRAD